MSEPPLRSPLSVAHVDPFACPTPAPLVSLIILTCNRHAFLRLALRAAAAQTYSAIEVIIVDDGPRAAASRTEMLSRGYRFPVRLIRMRSRRSIGSKRNAGVRAARGAVMLHWDDDDIHHPSQVATLACPILSGVADVTALTFAYLARLSTTEMQIFAYRQQPHGRIKRSDTGPFLGTLGYSREVAAALSVRGGGGSGGSGGPFANTSLSEDLDFVERALDQCRRMLPIAWRAPVVYTRHAAVPNTWRPRDVEERMTTAMTAAAAAAATTSTLGRAVAPARTGHAKLAEPPTFVDAATRAAYVDAERDAARLGACHARAREEPSALRLRRARGVPLRFPYMPARCCRGEGAVRQRRPCTDSPVPGRADACGDETFCGATKGVCTARCTCEGDAAHGVADRIACGPACCNFWRRFWASHPQNCSTTRGPRPLKRRYCPT